MTGFGFSKYWHVGLTAARSNLAYLGEIAARVIFLGVILFIFLKLWQLTYTETGTDRLGGLSLPQMLLYLAMTESIVLSAPRISADIDEDVRSGALAVHLLKPISYPLYRMWVTLGERGVRFLLNASVAVVLVFLFVGPIPLSPSGVAMAALVLPLAFVLDFLGFFLVGICAFWLEDTSGLWLIYSRVTLILGGTLIPLELFPDALQPILKVLPFSGIVYGPTRLLVKPDAGFLIDLLLRQTVAIGVVSMIAWMVYRVALKRIASNGG